MRGQTALRETAIDELIEETEVAGLTEEFRKFALQHADTIGFAPVERFGGAPDGRKPTDMMPHCRTVISFTTKHLDAFGESRDLSAQCYSQDITNHASVHNGYVMARYLEKKGYDAFPLVASHGAWAYVEPRDCPASISQRHAAELAGIGMIGWNAMLVTPEFGPRVQLGVIMTDAVLTPTPMLEKNPCNGCGLCVKACPGNVLEKPEPGQQYVPIFGTMKCPTYRKTTGSKSPLGYKGGCGHCRAVCPVGRRKKQIQNTEFKMQNSKLPHA